MDQTSLVTVAIAAFTDRYYTQQSAGLGRGPRTRTYQIYGYALQSFRTFLAEERELDVPVLADLTVDDLADFARWLGQRYQPTTIQLYVTALKGLLRFLARRNLLAFPVEEALGRYLDERPRFRYPTPEVVEEAALILALHRAAQPPLVGPTAPRPARIRALGWLRDQALLQLLFSTGARISEALALTRVDVRNGRSALVMVHGKGGKERPLQLPPDDRAAIVAYLAARQDPSPHLFISFQGRTPGAPLSRSYAWKLVTSLATAAELEGLSPHGIRRWLATMALRNGVDLKTISAALGHSSTAVTEQVYAFVAREQVAERWGAAAAELRAATGQLAAPEVLPAVLDTTGT